MEYFTVLKIKTDSSSCTSHLDFRKHSQFSNCWEKHPCARKTISGIRECFYYMKNFLCMISNWHFFCITPPPLISGSCPKIYDHDQKHTLFSNIPHFCTPKWCTNTFIVCFWKTTPSYVNFFTRIISNFKYKWTPPPLGCEQLISKTLPLKPIVWLCFSWCYYRSFIPVHEIPTNSWMPLTLPFVWSYQQWWLLILQCQVLPHTLLI